MENRKLFSTFALALAIIFMPAHQADKVKGPLGPGYVCLDPVVKAEATDGRGMIFALIESRPHECETVVMISPLSEGDRNLLYEMSTDASNVLQLRMADDLRETHAKKRTWTPLIVQGVGNFRRLRNQFCSTHPDMFVYDLTDLGDHTAPQPCSKAAMGNTS